MIQALCFTVWRRPFDVLRWHPTFVFYVVATSSWLDAFFLATTLRSKSCSTFYFYGRHVKGDGSFPGRAKSMSCRRAARMAARQIGGQLGCSCQSIFSEGRARGGLSSPGRAGVYEWNTHLDEFSGRRGRGRRELIGCHRRRRRPVPSSVKFRILLHVIM